MTDFTIQVGPVSTRVTGPCMTCRQTVVLVIPNEEVLDVVNTHQRVVAISDARRKLVFPPTDTLE